MCLYLFSTGCKDCGKCCLAFLNSLRCFLVLPFVLLGVIAIFLVTLVISIVKWLPMSWKREKDSWLRYWRVLRDGAKEYKGGDKSSRQSNHSYAIAIPANEKEGGSGPVANAVPMGTPVNGHQSKKKFFCCPASLVGEAYCCCLPVFLLWLLVLPIWVLIELLFLTLRATWRAIPLSCVKHFSELGSSLKKQIQGYDELTSAMAYGDAKKGRLAKHLL
mmetsp:Transcript_32938/g.63452  ORF Transcript_32938/g.63452 Transcript_32938/m.63452 type:complete len:218 (-) Transcript_32938:510-1163(-)